ncbi:MAG: hypothetical protein HOH95_03540 [Dehalococcoidia bacterium]|jgi:ketosteroid isomerase-like protein|nr:hypothetical protein [Dehalococcoidia bacterium]
MSASARWLVGIAVAIAAIVVASVVVALTLGDTETVFDPGTPEATVQAYFRAIQDGDAEASAALFTAELQGRCSTEELRRSYQHQEDFSVRIRDTTVRMGVTEIDVRIAISGGDSPFGNGYDMDQLILLVQEDGEWRIMESPWPSYCPPAPVQRSIE